MGGEFAVPNLAGVGAYTLSNTGLLTVNGSENIGQLAGTATFTQSGGTNICPSLSVAAGIGTYNLNGGLLNVATLLSGPLNFTAGTLQAGGALSLDTAIDLSAGTSTCRIDMNGQQVNIGTLVTSNLTDLHFANPGNGDLLAIGTSVTVGLGTEITLGTTPAATPGLYYDLIAGDANYATDVANFTLVGASGP